MSALALSGKNMHIYCELMSREAKGTKKWDFEYGPRSLTRTPSQQEMLNLGTFSKYQLKMSSASMSPMAGQLEALRAERRKAQHEFQSFTKKHLPKHSDLPVSASSVEVWGANAWHARPITTPSTSTYESPITISPEWTRRKWAVDRQHHCMVPGPIDEKMLRSASTSSLAPIDARRLRSASASSLAPIHAQTMLPRPPLRPVTRG